MKIVRGSTSQDSIFYYILSARQPAAMSVKDHHAVHTEDAAQASNMVMENNSNVDYDVPYQLLA